MFAKMIQERTGDQIIINVAGGGQLGGDIEIIESLQRGSLEMAVSSHGTMAFFDPRMGIAQGCSLIESYEEADKYLFDDGELAILIKEIMAENRVHALSFLDNEFRYVFNSKRPIKTLDDMKGLKLRVPEVAFAVEIFKRFGAMPVSIAWPELYTALQQGTVDGLEAGVILAEASKFQEIQKYASDTFHLYVTASIVISDSFWRSLSADEQKIFQETADEVSMWQRKANRDLVEETIEKMEAAGVQFTKLSPEVREEIREILHGMKDFYSKTVGKELTDRVFHMILEDK
jgi:tripartite ATP-independent transporter DctP family solute receptor